MPNVRLSNALSNCRRLGNVRTQKVLVHSPCIDDMLFLKRHSTRAFKDSHLFGVLLREYKYKLQSSNRCRLLDSLVIKV